MHSHSERRGSWHWAVGHSQVHLGDHVEVGEGDGLQLGAVVGDGQEVLGGDDGAVGALHVQPGDTTPAGLQELLQTGELVGGVGEDEGDLVQRVSQGLEGDAQGGQGLRHEELEGPELGADLEDLCQPVTAGVVDQVERLEGGVSGVRPDVAPVVLVNPVMEVSQVDDLKSNGLTSPLDRDWSGQD